MVADAAGMSVLGFGLIFNYQIAKFLAITGLLASHPEQNSRNRMRDDLRALHIRPIHFRGV